MKFGDQRKTNKRLLFCACVSSEKLGICHVLRTVSRNRRILLVMELHGGQSGNSCCIFTDNILT